MCRFSHEYSSLFHHSDQYDFYVFAMVHRLSLGALCELNHFISSAEPKAYRWAYSIHRHPSSVRPSSTFSNNFSDEAMKPITTKFHIYIYRLGERIIVFLFQTDKNFDCYGNLYLSLTYNGKSENWHILSSHCKYFDKNFYRLKCSLSSPLWRV